MLRRLDDEGLARRRAVGAPRDDDVVAGAPRVDVAHVHDLVHRLAADVDNDLLVGHRDPGWGRRRARGP